MSRSESVQILGSRIQLPAVHISHFCNPLFTGPRTGGVLSSTTKGQGVMGWEVFPGSRSSTVSSYAQISLRWGTTPVLGMLREKH